MSMCQIESMVALGEIDFPAEECSVLSFSMVSQAEEESVVNSFPPVAVLL